MQVRVVMFMRTITDSMLDAMANVQAALNKALTPTPANTRALFGAPSRPSSAAVPCNC